MRARLARTTVIAALLSVSALVPAPAGAGGPTSAFLSIPGSGQTASLYYTDPEYDELSGLVGISEPNGTFGGEESEVGHASGPGVTVTWLVHDVAPWRVDRVYVGNAGEVWISTQLGMDASIWDSAPVWHQPENGKRLAALLAELGVGETAADGSHEGVAGAATPDDAPPATTPPARAPDTIPDEPATADAAWYAGAGWALGGPFLGLATGLLVALGWARMRREGAADGLPTYTDQHAELLVR